MGFWKKLGKGLLKVAPIAAAFIPGVGPLASAAIGGFSGALDKKLSGGSWMDALKSGGIGAATGWAGAKIPAKGLGPTKGFWGKVGNIAKRAGPSILKNTMDQGGVRGGSRGPFDYGGVGIDESGAFGRQRGGGWQSMLGDVVNRYGSRDEEEREEQPTRSSRYGRSGQSRGRAEERGGGRGMSRFSRNMRRQLGPVMGEEDQSNPNLANALGAGRMDAMRSQPFRYGYDVTSYDYDDEGNETERIDMMPPIYPQSRGRRRGRGQSNDGRMY